MKNNKTDHAVGINELFSPSINLMMRTHKLLYNFAYDQLGLEFHTHLVDTIKMQGISLAFSTFTREQDYI